MLRKLLICTMLVIFTVLSLAFAAPNTSQEMTVLDKTVAMEKIIYGAEQTGSLVERITKLEKDIYGQGSKEAIMARADKLYTYIKVNSAASPSFLVKLNAVEWSLSHEVTTQPAKPRIENIERTLVGNSTGGALDDRLTKLLKMAYSTGQPDVAGTTINKDTLVKIKIVSPLGSRTSRVGDEVVFQAAEDVYAGPVLVIPKGAQGIGKVEKVEQAKNFGRDAELKITFDSIDSVDGSTVSTFLGEKAKEETKSLAKAAGATVAGLAILGPIGVVGGAFVHGQEITIPAGTEMYIQTKTDTEVYGIQVK